MKKFVNPIIIYVILWCVYTLQGFLYPSGSIISRLLVLIIILWSLISMYRVNTKSKKCPSFFKALNIFVLMATFYGVMLILSNQELYVTEGMYIKTSNYEYLKNIYISLLPFYVFYDYSARGKLTVRHILIMTLVLLSVTIVTFLYDRAMAILSAAQLGIIRDGFTLNVGYTFLSLMPLLIFWDRMKFWQFMILIVILFFIVLCMKRGAILVGAVCFMYFLYSSIRSSSGSRKTLVVILSILALVATSLVVYHLFNNNDYFAQRVQQTLEGNSSNRDELYSIYYNHFMSERNFFRFFFGNGANSTLSIGYNYAHNDWLEIAINNGVLGLVIYLCYFFSLFKDYVRAKSRNVVSARVIMMAIIIMFSTSLFSMSYAAMNIGLSMPLGLALAHVYNQHSETYR